MKDGLPEHIASIAERLRIVAEREPDIAKELRRYANDLDGVARDLSEREANPECIEKVERHSAG